MKEITGIELEKIPHGKLEHITDLIFFDGPLLSYFKDDRNKHYLYLWCDLDENCNRWLILELEKSDIIKYVQFYCSLYSLLFLSKKLYVVDIDASGNHKNIVQIKVEQIPKEYLPAIDSYYYSERDYNENPKENK